MSGMEKAYTHLELEAAICVWEEINERTLHSKKGTHPELQKCREDWGSATLRHASIAIGRFCLKVYALLPEDVKDGRAYDWEIIPGIMDHVDFSQSGEPSEYKFKEPQEVADVLIAAWRFDDWLSAANRELKQGWAIDFHEAGASVDDMRAYHASDPTTTGLEMAQWWANKYDLDRVDQPWGRL